MKKRVQTAWINVLCLAAACITLFHEETGRSHDAGRPGGR